MFKWVYLANERPEPVRLGTVQPDCYGIQTLIFSWNRVAEGNKTHSAWQHSNFSFVAYCSFMSYAGWS